MKVFFYINTIGHGGAERVITNVASMMADKGHECVLVTSARRNWEYPINQKVERVSLDEYYQRGFIKRNVGLILALRRIIKQRMPDLLVSFMAEPNFRALAATLGTKTNTVISVRSDPEYEYGSGWVAKFAKLFFKLADGAVFQTIDAQTWFPFSIQKKSRVILNSVNDMFYSVKRCGAGQGIVTVGRISEQKNHRMLIKAYAEIADRIVDDLYIYGSGDVSELEDLAQSLGIKERVHMPGQVDDVVNTIKSAKLFVLSSNVEGMPNALMEAMAMGLPCVSTDCPCGGPKSLFVDKLSDYLVPVDDENVLAAMMYRLICDSKELEELGTACSDAAKRFEPVVINEQWETYLKSVGIQ